MGSWLGGYLGDVSQQVQSGALNNAASAVAPSSPFLGTFLAKVLGSGGLGEWEGFYDNQFVQNPFTGNSYADPFTTEAYGSPDPLITGVGSIAEVLSVGGVPTEASLSDILAPFAAPAPDDLLASNDTQSLPDLDLESSTVQWRIVNGNLQQVFVPTSELVSPSVLQAVLQDAPASHFGFSSPTAPVSQPFTAAGQLTPPALSATVTPVASDYNPAAVRDDVPTVYVPPSPPPTEAWPTASLSPLPITSSPSTVTAPPNATTLNAPVIGQTTETPRDLWSTRFGNATQVVSPAASALPPLPAWPQISVLPASAPQRSPARPQLPVLPAFPDLELAILSPLVQPRLWAEVARTLIQIVNIFGGEPDLLHNPETPPDPEYPVEAPEPPDPLAPPPPRPEPLQNPDPWDALRPSKDLGLTAEEANAWEEALWDEDLLDKVFEAGADLLGDFLPPILTDSSGNLIGWDPGPGGA